MCVVCYDVKVIVVVFECQDLLPELQAVCQCVETVAPAPEISLTEPGPAATPTVADPSDPSSEPQPRGQKRKREDDGNNCQPAKKILGDGTRSPTTPVSWTSSKTHIVIR